MHITISERRYGGSVYVANSFLSSCLGMLQDKQQFMCIKANANLGLHGCFDLKTY